MCLFGGSCRGDLSVRWVVRCASPWSIGFSSPPGVLVVQHLHSEFEELGVDIAVVSADSRGKACTFVSHCPDRDMEP